MSSLVLGLVAAVTILHVSHSHQTITDYNELEFSKTVLTEDKVLNLLKKAFKMSQESYKLTQDILSLIKEFQTEDTVHANHKDPRHSRVKHHHKQSTDKWRPFSLMSITKSILLIFGLQSFLKSSYIVGKEIRKRVLPRSKLFWKSFVHEVSFSEPFDYLVDILPQS